MFPLLSLAQIQIDLELARRLPRRLAYYHLALPIAEDDSQITVAMAYPDNRRVEEVIRAALGTQIIAVRSRTDEILGALDMAWQPEVLERGGVICWTDVPERRAEICEYGRQFAAALGLAFNASDALMLDSFVDEVSTHRPTLIVCNADNQQTIEVLLKHSLASILLVHGRANPPQAILHVLRGHTPDKHALDWVASLAQHFGAWITLMAAATAVEIPRGNPLMSDFAKLILPDHPAQVVEFGQILASMNLRGNIKFTEGQLEDLLSMELRNKPYDLIVIAAEVNGEVVHRVMQQLGIRKNFLIVKP